MVKIFREILFSFKREDDKLIQLSLKEKRLRLKILQFNWSLKEIIIRYKSKIEAAEK